MYLFTLPVLNPRSLSQLISSFLTSNLPILVVQSNRIMPRICFKIMEDGETREVSAIVRENMSVLLAAQGAGIEGLERYKFLGRSFNDWNSIVKDGRLYVLRKTSFLD